MTEVTEADLRAAEAALPALLASIKGEEGGQSLTQAFATHRIEAARLGIIEGLEMAHQHLALVYLTNEATACEVYLEGLQDAAAAIRALIEEQKL